MENIVKKLQKKLDNKKMTLVENSWTISSNEFSIQTNKKLIKATKHQIKLLEEKISSQHSKLATQEENNLLLKSKVQENNRIISNNIIKLDELSDYLEKVENENDTLISKLEEQAEINRYLAFQEKSIANQLNVLNKANIQLNNSVSKELENIKMNKLYKKCNLTNYRVSKQNFRFSKDNIDLINGLIVNFEKLKKIAGIATEDREQQQIYLREKNSRKKISLRLTIDEKTNTLLLDELFEVFQQDIKNDLWYLRSSIKFKKENKVLLIEAVFDELNYNDKVEESTETHSISVSV